MSSVISTKTIQKRLKTRSFKTKKNFITSDLDLNNSLNLYPSQRTRIQCSKDRRHISEVSPDRVHTKTPGEDSF